MCNARFEDVFERDRMECKGCGNLFDQDQLNDNDECRDCVIMTSAHEEEYLDALDEIERHTYTEDFDDWIYA